MNPPPPPPPTAPAAPPVVPAPYQDPAALDLVALEKEIADWNNAQVQLSLWKDKESKLRRTLADKLLGGQKNAAGVLPEGTNKNAIAGATVDIFAKVVQKYNHSIEESLMVVTLQEANLTAEQGEGLIKTKYEMSMTALKKLPDDKQIIVRKMLTSKPGSIELEIKTTPKSQAG